MHALLASHGPLALARARLEDAPVSAPTPARRYPRAVLLTSSSASSSSPNPNPSSTENELRAVLRRTASNKTEENTLAIDTGGDHPKDQAAPAPAAAAGGGAPAAARPRRDPARENRPISQILLEAGRSALGGGIPGAMAMAIQVLALMWLRTTMNYQYAKGMSTSQALRTLYAEGGIPRFYRGLGPALIQGPLSRFGDTASNAGMLSLLNQSDATRDLPVLVKTSAASFTAGIFRIVLMPVDFFKTTYQVAGADAGQLIRDKFKKGGPRVMFHGAIGAAGATMVGHYPFFATFNFLQEVVPKQSTLWGKLWRNAGIGFCSSTISDCISNSLRVIKTTKQTSKELISYPQAVKMVIDQDGVRGLFLRGLGTRLIANGFQAALFTVLWKGIEERFFTAPKKQ